MRIAIPDDYQKCITSLEVFNLLKGHEVTIVHDYLPDPKQLVKKLNDPEALVLTRTRTAITSDLLDLLPNLKVISQTGKNADHLDIEACANRGITILEGRGDPTATAELTWSLIMNGLRLLPQAIQGMRVGRWQTNIGRQVKGKTIGIWGYGRIGKKIATYAKTFEGEVVVWGSQESRNQAIRDGYISAVDKKHFFKICDVVSLNLRLKESTKEIVSYQDLILMKTNALLVNTARAGLIKKGALIKALKNGRPGFAAIDVFDEEPIYDKEHPLLKMDNVICTPHLGYVEESSYELYFGIAFQNLVDYISL